MDTQQQLAEMGLHTATPQPVEPAQPITPAPEPQPEPIPAPEPAPAPEADESHERDKQRAKYYQSEYQRLLETLKISDPDFVEKFKQEAIKHRGGAVQPVAPEDPNEDYESRIVKLAQQGVRQELEQERLRLQVEADVRESDTMWNQYIQQVQPDQATIDRAAQYVNAHYGIDPRLPKGPQKWARAVFDVIDKMELSQHFAQRETMAAAEAAAKAKAIATIAIPEGQPAPAPDARPKTPAQKQLDAMGLYNTNLRTP